MALGQLREVLARVVDDPVRTERPGLLDVPGAANGRHVRIEDLGELHRKRANTP
jgi:hypothetical protein